MKYFLPLILFFPVLALAAGGGGHGGVPGVVYNQVINIAILVAIIYFWQGKNIAAFFAGKKEAYLASVKAASDSKKAAEAKEAEIQGRLDALRKNFESDLEEAHKNADENYRISISNARNEAMKIEKDAETYLETELNKATENLRLEAFAKSADMAEQKMEKNFSEEKQQAWNHSFSNRVKGVH